MCPLLPPPPRSPASQGAIHWLMPHLLDPSCRGGGIEEGEPGARPPETLQRRAPILMPWQDHRLPPSAARYPATLASRPPSPSFPARASAAGAPLTRSQGEPPTVKHLKCEHVLVKHYIMCFRISNPNSCHNNLLLKGILLSPFHS